MEREVAEREDENTVLEGAEKVAVHDMGSQGEGVARLASGQVVFIEGTFPGDVVWVQPLSQILPQKTSQTLSQTLSQTAASQSSGRFPHSPTHLTAQSRVVDSPQRVKPHCIETECGGCRFVGWDVIAQKKHKRSRVVEALRRIGGVQDADALVAQKVVGGAGTAYRHRIRLHAAYVDRRGPVDSRGPKGGWQIGFMARGTDKVIEVKSCPVLWPKLDKLRLDMAYLVQNWPQEAGLLEVSIAWSDAEDGALLHLVSDPYSRQAALPQEPPDIRWPSQVLGGTWDFGGKIFEFGRIDALYDGAVGPPLRFCSRSFTQASPALNQDLVLHVAKVCQEALQGSKDTARRDAENIDIVELHAGIGNLSMPLAHAGFDVWASELSASAVMTFEGNLQSNLQNKPHLGQHAQIHRLKDVDAAQNAPLAKVLLLDPPRGGAKEALKIWKQRFMAKGEDAPPSRVVYVSCDPATLARDVAILQSGGWQCGEVWLGDMFPQTPHVEAIAVLDRPQGVAHA